MVVVQSVVIAVTLLCVIAGARFAIEMGPSETESDSF
jgi:hypothetical protein